MYLWYCTGCIESYSDSEEVSDQDTDSDIVECGESFGVLYFKMYS